MNDNNKEISKGEDGVGVKHVIGGFDGTDMDINKAKDENDVDNRFSFFCCCSQQHQSSSSKASSFCDRLLSDVSMISVLVFFALFFKGFTLTMVIPIIPKALHLEDDAFLTSKFRERERFY